MAGDTTRVTKRGLGAMLSPADVAERLGLSRLTVYRMIAAGRLGPAVHMGRLVRVPEAAVDDYIIRSLAMRGATDQERM